MPGAALRRPPLGRALGGALALAGLASLAGTPAVEAQQPAAPGDTADAAADMATAAADTVDRAPRSFPDLRAGVASAGAGDARVWDREDLVASSALTVVDFLSDRAPGLLPLRASFYFGPHQIADGLLGPGGVRVVVDGRELPSLASAQADLSRLALARVDRLAVIRRAGEVVVSVTTPNHPGGEAYSRITGGTGQPGADLIRGVFTNGGGRHFAVGAAVDHLNIGAGPGPGSRLDAWGKLSWMPFGDDSGVEVLWHSDAMNRDAAQDEDFTRSEILLHGRALPVEGVQLDIWAGQTSRDPAPPFLGDTLDGGADPTPADTARESLEVPHAEVGVVAARGPLTLEGDARIRDADGLPRVGADVRAAVRVAGGLTIHGGWGYGAWEDFDTSAWSGGVTFRPGDGEGIALRAEASAGTRGLARPGRTADSVSFDAVSGSARVGVGPYRVSGRATRRSVERRLPLGGGVDAGLVTGPASTVIGLEGAVRGPIVPIEFLEDRLRFEGFWRRNTAESGSLPVYVPRDLARAEFRFQDTYFGGNLGVRALVRILRRGAMTSSAPGSPEPVVLADESTVGTSVVIRIDTFRLWWRVDNARRLEQSDFGGLPFPTQRNVVGVTWAFFD